MLSALSQTQEADTNPRWPQRGLRVVQWERLCQREDLQEAGGCASCVWRHQCDRGARECGAALLVEGKPRSGAPEHCLQEELPGQQVVTVSEHMHGGCLARASMREGPELVGEKDQRRQRPE